MAYDCIRCLATTDNDDDICDDCKREARDDEMVCTLRERIEMLVSALEGVVRVADRATVEFDAARNAIALIRKTK